MTVQLDSVPQGAEARASTGSSCKTPCSVEVPGTDSFSVTFTLPKFQVATVPVTVTRTPGDFTSPPTTTIDPNPVMAELQPLGPVKKARTVRKRKPKPAAAAPAESPFPQPEAAPER